MKNKNILIKKTEDKTNDENGNRLENLVRCTLQRIYLFIVNEIETRLAKMNKKIKIVSIYNDITGNSTEKFKEIFDEIISNILKRKIENEQVIDEILNDNRDLDELRTLKELLNMKYFDIINKFIKDECLILANGTKIQINIFGKEKSKKKKEISERIQGKIEEIKFKIKEILECEKERMREKTEKS